jgi:DNA polymerase-1
MKRGSTVADSNGGRTRFPRPSQERTMKKRFFVIDGHALCYRAYYAFIRSPLVNSSGQNTSAIFGFARMLFKLISEQKPDYLAVAFDPPRKTFRHELFADYKANRQKMPDDLRPQIDEIKRMVELAGIPRLEVDGYEADDILGSIAKRYAGGDVEVVLVTGDKDAYQLAGEGVRIYAAKKGISEYEMYDAAAVTEKLGVRPDQVIDYMALTGDASDNVPGVKGIGEKNAQKLIAAFGSIDAIYGRLDEIKGKQREHLDAGRESAYLSRDLVTIRTDVPLRIGIEEARMPALDMQAMREYFNRLEMKSVAQDFFSGTADAASPAPETGETREKDYRIVRTASELREAMRAVREAGVVSFDTETTSVDPVEAELVGMSFSVGEHSGCYVPVACGGLFESVVLGADEALAIVSPMLADASVKKIGQNIKYDIVVLKKYGVEVRGVHFDTMIASYLLDPAARNHNLDDMAERFLNYKTITYEELVGKGKSAVPITEVPVERVAEYAIEDADVTLRLYRVLAPMLASENLEKLFSDIEMPLVDVLAEMEWKGVRIDAAHFAALGAENSRMLAEEEQRVYDIAGGRFNINSTRELASVLFEKLALKPVKKTKTGFSTDIQVLEELRGRHEIIDHLIAYRTLVKLKSTYIDTLPGLVSERTGRLHTSYNQTIVATGRLSSSYPICRIFRCATSSGARSAGDSCPKRGAS